jgi:hypothetical protein
MFIVYLPFRSNKQTNNTLKQNIMINYNKLMAHNPTSFGTMVNSLGQTIEFYEHPTKGDEAEVLCVCHELQLADYSTFYETTDMLEDHKEYEPSFQNGKLVIGDFLNS